MEFLAPERGGFFVDATLGAGGHAEALLERGPEIRLLALDRDPDALALSQRRLARFGARVAFAAENFADLERVLDDSPAADGILADLGVSSMQLEQGPRGFSFRRDGPLDMRMDQTKGTTAADLVNYTAEKALADLIYQLGEERRARKIARAIVRARPIRSTRHLADVVERAAHRTGRLHPATQTFMALRIKVNAEQEELDRLLEMAPELVKSKGRVVVISFMSLEDRKVKNKFRDLDREGRATTLTKRPLRPTEDEVRANPAARSAKLRALEMN